MSSLSTAFPEVIRKEIDHFADQSKEYRASAIADEVFKPFRLVHGIYGQRQENVQMVRIKIPGGQLSATQARALSEASRLYAPRGIAHVTTRQAVQLHFVQLEQVPALMELLASVDLTSREACGNAIRNITCSPVSGLAADEIFDAFPYAEAAFRYFLRRPEFTQLPRKFKMAFGGSDRDLARPPSTTWAPRPALASSTASFNAASASASGGGLGASPQTPGPGRTSPPRTRCCR